MGLISSKEISKFLGLEKLGFLGTSISNFVLRITKLSKLNQIYDANRHLSDQAFYDALINDFNIEFEVSEKDLKRIPKEGSFITVSNHPLGGVDGILLLKLLTHKRPDYKIIANFLLHKIEPMQPYVLPVNPFDKHKDAKSSVGGVKAALQHIKEGYPLGIFPAGEVSTIKENGIVVDRDWEPGALRLIQKAEVPVVPIYFHAKNSKLFYFLAKISDTLRTAKLPSELAKRKKNKISVRVGNPISVEKQAIFQTHIELGAFLRKKTYLFSNTIGSNKLMHLKRARKIASPKKKKVLLSEIHELEKNGKILFSTENYHVFLTEAATIPKVLKEIGRLREITFRQVGEGTNKKRDLDKFDKYYHHLILWDHKEKVLVGAYRMGLGNQIYKNYGIDGFYLHSFYQFGEKLHDMLGKTIEMGRAFVIKEYQQRPMPLFLLWKGVIKTILNNPEHKYLLGSVSISNEFSDFSKSIMVRFIEKNYKDHEMAKFLNTQNEYQVALKEEDEVFIFSQLGSNFNALDRLIEELEPKNMRVPVLIKKYIKQNVKALTFTVDPEFNNSLDCLMYVNIDDIPQEMITEAT